MRRLIYALGVVMLTIIVVAPLIARAATPSRSALSNLLVVNPDTVKQTATYDAISKLPASDDDVIVPWLRANVDRLQPLFLYELARRAFPTDHAAGLEWYALATIRAQYDAQRCADPSAANGVTLLAQRAQPIPAYVRTHHDELLAAFKRAMVRRDLFVDDISPRWICIHGIAAYSEEMSGKEPAVLVRPPSQWPQIREELRQRIAERAPPKQKSRPSWARGFSVRRLPVDGDALSIAWSPDGHLLATSSKSYVHITIWDARTGKPLQQLERNVAFGESLAFTPDGKYLLTATARRKTREEEDATVSIWDVSSGKVVKNVPGPHPGKGINENRAKSFALDARGRILAVLFHNLRPRLVGVYQATDWSLVRLLHETVHGFATSIALSPDGSRLERNPLKMGHSRRP